MFHFNLALFAAVPALAQNEIILDQIDHVELITPKFAVYWQDNAALSFEAFRASKDNMPYQFSEQSNFGFVKEGLWFHAKAINRTDVEKWLLSIRFAQLQDAELYVTQGEAVIYQLSDGISDKSSIYATPTFALNLPKDEHVEIFIYASSSSMSLLAPIYLQPETLHEKTVQLDFLLWGGFYGAILILAIYVITFSFNYPRLSNLIFFVHLLMVLIWQMNWSGHSYLLGDFLWQILRSIRPEALLMLLCISSTAFTLDILPKEKCRELMRLTMVLTMALAGVVFILVSAPLFSVEWRFVLTYLLGFFSLGLNLITAVHAFRRQYKPAQPIIIAWVIVLTGAVLSTLYIFGFLSTNTFNAQLFQLTLTLQAGAFLLAIVSKIQNELETELIQARADAENNFLLVEEQNVHLDMARKDALKASDVKSQFLANMSHEIRTPLNAIIGFSKALESKINVAEQDEHIKVINSAASDLLTLVNDILDFSKLEAGQLSLSEKPFQAKELFEDVAAVVSKTAHSKQLEFLYDIDQLPDILVGDSFRLKQLITNLLSNALKFTNYGHVALRAKVASQTTKECVLSITVEDSGIGISEADMQNIFKAFHQLDDDLSRSYQGTGLGLVICQEIVFLMKGELTVTSEPSVGSVFTATIPFNIQKVSNETAIAPPKKRTALLFDIWEESSRTLAKQLSFSGFETVCYDELEHLESDFSSLKPKIQSAAYLFVTLPLASREERQDIVSQISTFAPENTVLLFSGKTPSASLISTLPISTKVIRLPLTARKIAALDSGIIQDEASFDSKQIMNLPAVRILAVDDIELNLRLLQSWLKHSAITLDLAFDGPSAIEKCKQTEYDMILMDIQMPSMDGIAATKLIRKIPLNMGTPVIAVTAHALAEEKEHFLASGLEDFIAKPIELEKLVVLINEWCEFSEATVQKIPDSINWELALQRSNSNAEVAMSFMDDFVTHLEDHQKDIKHHAQHAQVDELLASVHKLHGACCYTGVPRLQSMCRELEEALKYNREYQYEEAVQGLISETKLLANDWLKRRQRFV